MASILNLIEVDANGEDDPDLESESSPPPLKRLKLGSIDIIAAAARLERPVATPCRALIALSSDEIDPDTSLLNVISPEEVEFMLFDKLDLEPSTENVVVPLADDVAHPVEVPHTADHVAVPLADHVAHPVEVPLAADHLAVPLAENVAHPAEVPPTADAEGPDLVEVPPDPVAVVELDPVPATTLAPTGFEDLLDKSALQVFLPKEVTEKHKEIAKAKEEDKERKQKEKKEKAETSKLARDQKKKAKEELEKAKQELKQAKQALKATAGSKKKVVRAAVTDGGDGDPPDFVGAAATQDAKSDYFPIPFRFPSATLSFSIVAFPVFHFHNFPIFHLYFMLIPILSHFNFFASKIKMTLGVFSGPWKM
jgi:hypothetical protein